ncbi:hypothetical protein [Lactococcus garvieae]|uniref:hypothetical protein n=1 Tax=Lactococcus garvieae TaxID=1363 RepID=UPI00254A11D5|nr:hypothetical protein [Lactococcus garvieae]
MSKVNQTIFISAQKKLDAIEESQSFTEHNILKENLSLTHTPDYSKAKPYSYKISPDKIIFGNGFELDIKNSKGLNEDFTQRDLEIKAKTGYSSVEPLAQYNFTDLIYKDMTDPIGVFISGNLIENYEIQVDKSKGSWAKVYQLEEKWNIKTGYVINYQSPKSDNSQSYMYMTRYWIFPDGVGVTVEKGGVFDGTLTPDSTKTTTQEDLDVINQYSQGMLGQLQSNFVMTTEK